MQLTVLTGSEDVFTVDVGEDIELENLLALCKLEAKSLANISTNQLVINHHNIQWNKNGKDGKKTIKEMNISEGDVILVESYSNSAGSSGSSAIAMPDFSSIKIPTKLDQNRNDNRPNPSAVYRQLIDNSEIRNQLREGNPRLYDAFDRRDFKQFETVFNEQMAEQNEIVKRRIRVLADPTGAEAQRFIEQEIQRENIQHSFETAMEQTPESFASVHMLYIDCKVNGHDIKAFVDSGAQRSIMHGKCAERCNILHLMDRRFQGTAMGVGGRQEILGRIHMAQVQIDTEFLPMSFDVLDDNQSMDVLLGLDMLKRHQCRIDLKTDRLAIGDHTLVAFLPENRLPKRPSEHVANDDEDAQLARALNDSVQNAPKKTAAIDPLVKRLVSMGFNETEAAIALINNNGYFDQALAFLTHKRN